MNVPNSASRKNRGGSNHKSVWHFLASIKLTIVLLILLALVSVIGTVIRQNGSEAEYLRLFSRETYELFKIIGFLDVYHSWWFNALIVFLCLNLLVCSIKSFPRTWKIISRTTATLESERLKTLPYVTTITVTEPLSTVREQVLPHIRSFLGAPRETKNQRDTHFFVEKARLSRLAVYATHASVIIILVGGLIGSIWGFKGTVTIVEGESVDRIVMFKDGMSLHKLGFELRCDNFEVSYYPSGTPKDYRSTLTIIENGKSVLTKDIEVNHPLRYKGLTFYQSSYGTASHEGKLIIEARRKNKADEVRSFTVDPGDSFDLSQSGLTVKVNRFFSDFVLDKDGNATNQSNQFNNPAVELLIFKGDEPQYRTWVFQKFPSFHGSKEGAYSFSFRGFEGKEYTGLQVTKDPGVNVVWSGCILMILGIMYTFFASHRQVWVRLSDESDGTNIVLAGTANKNRLGFKKDFEQFSEKIRNSFT